jgi:hypothetical protein
VKSLFRTTAKTKPLKKGLLGAEFKHDTFDIRTFINATVYPHPARQLKEKKKGWQEMPMPPEQGQTEWTVEQRVGGWWPPSSLCLSPALCPHTGTLTA